MFSLQHLELIYITKCLLLVSLYAASVPHTVPAKFTLSNFFDSTLSMIHPLVSAGSDRCESLKSFLGITYEQMQVKNKTNWYDVLNIDLVTKNGNIKYNLTATRRMNRLMARAQTIVILIHGFMESSNGWMVNALAPELLKKSVYKVFALDGRKIINLEYFSSSTNARFMGEMLGSFLSDVIKNGEDPSKIYIIGHSLGSHIAGIAGKKVYEVTGKRISRITALDPAGPCFSNITDSGRLARTDAEYVDVIHSNAGILGLKAPIGKRPDGLPDGRQLAPPMDTCTRKKELRVRCRPFRDKGFGDLGIEEGLGVGKDWASGRNAKILSLIDSYNVPECYKTSRYNQMEPSSGSANEQTDYLMVISAAHGHSQRRSYECVAELLGIRDLEI
ncbi:unnamed protein product [Spodoptera exigua]|nr:unnamed protein product [Spodoptera exigua]